MQTGSLIGTNMDYTIANNLIPHTIIVGIVPKPGLVFTCKKLYKSSDNIPCLELEEATPTNPFGIVTFNPDVWFELQPPMAINIDELMPEEAFAS